MEDNSGDLKSIYSARFYHTLTTSMLLKLVTVEEEKTGLLPTFTEPILENRQKNIQATITKAKTKQNKKPTKRESWSRQPKAPRKSLMEERAEEWTGRVNTSGPTPRALPRCAATHA